MHSLLFFTINLLNLVRHLTVINIIIWYSILKIQLVNVFVAYAKGFLCIIINIVSQYFPILKT